MNKQYQEKEVALAEMIKTALNKAQQDKKQELLNIEQKSKEAKKALEQATQMNFEKAKKVAIDYQNKLALIKKEIEHLISFMHKNKETQNII